MRESGAWGLESWLLAPSKTQTDPVHRDIYWTEIERLIIDSRPFQRLRHVKQLGMTLKVYPSAEHSRFTHGLGTLQAAQDIIDRVVANRAGPHHVLSLLDEWHDQGVLPLRLAEATVLARLASLMHDICHVPFGHTIEDDLGFLTSHDANEKRFREIWDQLPDAVRNAIGQASTELPIEGRETSLHKELRAIVLDKIVDENHKSLYPFVGDVVNNTICADLLDYLERDHYFTGLPFAVGDRFMDNFYIAPSSARSEYREHLIVRVTRAGESRIDTVTELLKYLRYRYEVTERALYHKTKLGYDAMLGKLLEMWHDALWHREAVQLYPELARERDAMNADWLRERLGDLATERPPPGTRTTPLVDELDSVVEATLERHFLFFGDEGLIEHLTWSLLEERGDLQEQSRDLDERWLAILDLAERLRYREHFRMIAHAGGPQVVPAAKDKHAQFGSAQARRHLERQAAKWAGIDPAWQVVLWVPGPNMRLKLADVLIEDRGMISTLADRYDDARQIARRHQELWATRVYAVPELGENERVRDRVLSFLHDEMQLPFVLPDGRPVVSSNRLAAEEVAAEKRLQRPQIERIARQLEGVAARSETRTFEDLLQIARGLAEQVDPAGSGSPATPTSRRRNRR
jgi:HD superfamily phosphohydrolase